MHVLVSFQAKTAMRTMRGTAGKSEKHEKKRKDLAMRRRTGAKTQFWVLLEVSSECSSSCLSTGMWIPREIGEASVSARAQ